MKYDINPKVCILIDERDLIFVKKFYWRASGDRNNKIYIVTRKMKNGITKHKSLHRLLIGAKDGEQVDHINGDTLDNRRSNLRICNHCQNSQNMKSHKDSKSKFKGISWIKKENRWVVQVTANGERNYIGRFINEIDAALAYDLAAQKYHGEYARLNFSRG